MFETPILFLIFNRLDTANQVFKKIKEQKPKYLYIAADWPRKNKKWEAEACKKTRETILSQVNWDCELKTLFRDENLWCKKAVSWAITWFFENVDQWIILEDDCLPDPSFFWFCETMLEKYQDDKRIMHISWSCHLDKKYQKENTYEFSYYSHIRWWATRKRAWSLYDIDMKDLDDFIRNKQINLISGNYFSKNVMLRHFIDCRNWKIDTRDYQWLYSMRLNNWLAIQPLVNLISNIWFSTDALHTKNDFWMGNLDTQKIEYKKLRHPNNFILNLEHRKYEEKYVQLSFKQYVANILRKIWIYKIVAKILWYNA